MKCEEALELMSAVLDGEATAQERAALEAHLATCPECAALYEALSDQSRLLRGLDCQVPEGLSQRIMSQLPEQSAQPKKPRRVIHWQRWGVLAACVALVVWVGVTQPSFLRMGNSGSDSIRDAASGEAAPQSNTAPAYSEGTGDTTSGAVKEREPDPNEPASAPADSGKSGESPSPISAQYLRVTWTEQAAPAAQLLTSTDDLFNLMENYPYDDLFRATSQYDDLFFAHSCLIAVSLTASSGSVTYTVEDVQPEDEGWDVVIQSTAPQVGTDDMAAWLILIETDQDIAPTDPITVTLTH